MSRKPLDQPTLSRQELLDLIKNDGLRLRDGSDMQKDDREIVMAAVSQNGLALWFASARMQDNQDVVMAAVGQNWKSLQFASTTLRMQIGLGANGLWT